MTLTALDVVDRKQLRLRDVISGNALRIPEIVHHEDSVQSAAERLDRAGAKAILVLADDGALLGLVSPHDIVRHIARSGAQALDWPVSRVMTPDVIVGRIDTGCRDALMQMFEQRFRNMPVYDTDNALLACVETLDVAKAKLAELTEANRKLMNLLLSQSTERDTVAPDMDLASVLGHMRCHELDHVMVYDGTRCLGYITPNEALRVLHQAPHGAQAPKTDAP